MSDKKGSEGGCLGYIAGIILLVLALLPSGVIAIILYFLLRKASNDRERLAFLSSGISAVVTWGLYLILMEKGIINSEFAKPIIIAFISIGAICYFLIYRDVKKADKNASPNKKIAIPLISTLFTLVFLYFFLWKNENRIDVFSNLVLTGTLIFFVSLFLYKEPSG